MKRNHEPAVNCTQNRRRPKAIWLGLVVDSQSDARASFANLIFPEQQIDGRTDLLLYLISGSTVTKSAPYRFNTNNV